MKNCSPANYTVIYCVHANVTGETVLQQISQWNIVCVQTANISMKNGFPANITVKILFGKYHNRKFCSGKYINGKLCCCKYWKENFTPAKITMCIVVISRY